MVVAVASVSVAAATTRACAAAAAAAALLRVVYRLPLLLVLLSLLLLLLLLLLVLRPLDVVPLLLFLLVGVSVVRGRRGASLPIPSPPAASLPPPAASPPPSHTLASQPPIRQLCALLATMLGTPSSPTSRSQPQPDCLGMFSVSLGF